MPIQSSKLIHQATHERQYALTKQQFRCYLLNGTESKLKINKIKQNFERRNINETIAQRGDSKMVLDAVKTFPVIIGAMR